jgi:conjugal transfer/entry exclusion protein
VLKKTEVVDYEGVLERMDQMKQMMAQIEEMQNYIKDLEGQLQTTTRESIHDKKRVEVEKFKTKLHQLATRAEGATKIFDARLNDELKKEKESQREKKQKESGGRRVYQRV